MANWLTRLFRNDQLPPAHAAKHVLGLQSDAQARRLELEEQTRVAANLKNELERQRASETGRVADAVQAHWERLMTEAAGPISQLLTQAHLLEVDGKSVQARDVLAVAKRLVRMLETHGLAFEGVVGAKIAFDPNRHEPLSRETMLAPGQPAVVRFVGVVCRGKILRKAGVEKGGG